MLRDALFQERDKAERAMKKSVEADILVGKGCYNAETTRILHLVKNPLSTAVNNKFMKERQLWRGGVSLDIFML